MRNPHYVTETKAVNDLAADPECDWEYTGHALREMQDEDPPITGPDVECALQNGKVTLEEYKKNILWRVHGRDLDLRPIAVVVAVFEKLKKIKVVTAFCLKKLR
jgi:hypothetical protein